MNNDVLKTVLTASVGEHIAAFKALTEASTLDIVKARKALRDWIGTQEHTSFQNIDDMGVMCVLLEEFANFAIFVGEQIHEENKNVHLQKDGNA